MAVPKAPSTVSSSSSSSNRKSSTTLRRRQTSSSICGSTQRLLMIVTSVLFLAYFYLLSVTLHQATLSRAQGSSSSSGSSGNNNLRPGSQGRTLKQQTKSTFQQWKDFAMDLAGQSPSTIVDTLRSTDPFGVRRFERQLQEAEAQNQAFLTLEKVQELFPCPQQERITLPDQRNHVKAEAFRNGTESYFLFFQHLRKAGGTNFCSLAQHNLPKRNVPKYYCMPDYYWEAPKGTQQKCAGCFKRFSNEAIATNMAKEHARILGNEWDNFDSRFLDLPATFATSFRRPLDRALSQFRFECIEERGCKIKNVTQWWTKRTDLTNVYTWTFAGQGVRRMSIGESSRDSEMRREAIGKALDVIVRFNLVMVMEWLAYAPSHVQQVLGFQDTKTLTERVRPHIGQARRDDGQEHNQLGAGDLAKASWTPENYLPPDLYNIMSRDLALDEILTDAARRIFLERLVCGDVDAVQ